MQSPRKLKKRPCSICRRWFVPDPRAAHCQNTCGPACRKLYAARKQAKWRARHPDSRQDQLLRARLKQADEPGAFLEIGPPTAPLARLPWQHLVTAFGVKKTVLLAFALRLQSAERVTAFKVKIRMPPPSPERHALDLRETAMDRAP